MIIILGFGSPRKTPEKLFNKILFELKLRNVHVDLNSKVGLLTLLLLTSTTSSASAEDLNSSSNLNTLISDVYNFLQVTAIPSVYALSEVLKTRTCIVSYGKMKLFSLRKSNISNKD